MVNVSFSYEQALPFVSEAEMAAMKFQTENAKDRLLSRDGEGHDFLGWLDLPTRYDREEYRRILAAAEKIRSDSEVLLVIGIGGSYLGARAAIEFLGHAYANELDDAARKAPRIYYVGNSLSPDYLQDIFALLGEKDYSINVISKSGTTTEPAIAFRIFRDHIEKKYGKEEAARRIYATSDKARGALKGLADAEGYECFVIPDDVGGRFSVLTAVGLLPIAVSGADIGKIMEGAQEARQLSITTPYEKNAPLLYAALRNILYRKGKTVEVLANYEPALHTLAEWWKQLFGESEGKDQRGIFPAAVDLTTDLHSMGQYIQDGSRILFETVLDVKTPNHDFAMTEEAEDADGLNYLAGKDLSFVNHSAMEGTVQAHVAGGVPNLRITLEKRDAYTLGQLFYFFEFACGVSGYLNGINPFDQPGVEFYKKNMFRLLGKPGYTE